jgi:hypothetical protein
MIRLKNAGALLPLVVAAALAGCSQNTEKAGSADTHTSPPAGSSEASPHGTSQQSAPAQSAPAQSAQPQTAPPQTAAAQNPAPAGEQSANGIAWNAPSGWAKEQPASTMRAAQYRLPSGKQGVKDGELAVFFFGPGQGGQTQANLERWAGQFVQEDGSDPMKSAKIDHFATSTGLKVTTIALKGHYQSGGMGGPSYDEPGWRLYGAVVEGDGGPWFFKTVGPDAVITQHHDEIVTFLKGLRIAR